MRTKYENSLVLLVFMLAIFAGFFLYNNHIFTKGELKKKETAKESLFILKNKLDNLELEAKAVSVYDITLDTKLYAKNDSIVLPIASLVKIMTVLVTLNTYDEDKQFTISDNALKQYGDNSLYVNEQWKLKDLIKFTLFLSSNDGAYTLGEDIPNFIEKMNEKAKRIGLTNTIFINQTGLDIDIEHAGAYGTAEEMNKLAVFAFNAYPEVFMSTAMKDKDFASLSGFLHKVQNTNTVIDKLPNILLSKTGNTNLAGGNLVIIFKNDEGHKIAVTILGSSIEGRFTDMEKIVSVLYN